MAYAPEQKVSYKGMSMPATIISGPHATYGADRWLVRKADGKVTLARESELTAIVDRRESVAKAAYEHFNRIGWSTGSTSSKRDYLAMADKVLAAIDAEAEPAKRPLAVGDQIRILLHGHQGATVRKGDVLTVESATARTINTNAPRATRGSRTWAFFRSAEGTGWERA